MQKRIFGMYTIQAVRARNENLYLTNTLLEKKDNPLVLKLWIANLLTEDISAQVDELSKSMMDCITKRLLDYND